MNCVFTCYCCVSLGSCGTRWALLVQGSRNSTLISACSPLVSSLGLLFVLFGELLIGLLVGLPRWTARWTPHLTPLLDSSVGLPHQTPLSNSVWPLRWTLSDPSVGPSIGPLRRTPSDSSIGPVGPRRTPPSDPSVGPLRRTPSDSSVGLRRSCYPRQW